MVVVVTEHHIAHGECNSITHNPIAISIQQSDRFAVVTSTKIHRECSHGYPGLSQYGCRAPWCGVTDLPASAREWLGRFNRRESVSAFYFEM